MALHAVSLMQRLLINTMVACHRLEVLRPGDKAGARGLQAEGGADTCGCGRPPFEGWWPFSAGAQSS